MNEGGKIRLRVAKVDCGRKFWIKGGKDLKHEIFRMWRIWKELY